MEETFYQAVFAVSIVLTVVYIFMWRKRFNLFITLMFVLIPISNMGFVLRAQSSSLDAMLGGQKLMYLGGAYNMLLALLSVFSLCRIKLPKYISGTLLTLNTFMYLCILTIGSDVKIFYKSVGIAYTENGPVLTREYGPLHTVFRGLTVFYFYMSLGAMIYAFIKKRDVSRHVVVMLFFVEAISIISYLFNSTISNRIEIEIVPLTYIIAQVVFLFISKRVSLYDITDTAIDSLVQTGSTGFMSFDFKYNYLGSNETARSFFPELNRLYVDKPINVDKILGATMIGWIKEFAEDETQNTAIYPRDDKVYLININYLSDGRKKRGYQFFITDDTKNQMYSTMLENEVEEKTRHIVEMHDRLILSMATMVESRDNSTGGHIRRTSDAVRILIGEMRKDDAFNISESFCRNMIKAAPMHDLGKIAVDDAILRKPGRFTPEEFEKMKAHSAEGAKIVHQILEGTDDLEFHILAENVAHYHHERWDGSGYPDGLAGEDIPLEARIMAVADVYDALVSKRVYKEKMSFEQANKIIMEGMGTHFDKRLEKYYVAARPKLEEYYRGLE